MATDATRYEGDIEDLEATRHEGGADPEATRHEGGADPEATRHEGSQAPGGDGAAWFTLPAGVEQRFEVLRLLSRAGGQADILLCRDRASGAELVVKLYRGRPQIDMSTYEKLKGLNSAHVSPILDLRVDGDGIWEVQEYFPYGSLHDVLQARGGGAQPEAWVREVLTELADALPEIHAERITHRDLKPGNVFVRKLEPLDLVLGDFGFARDIAMSSEYMSFVGVHHHTAPEVQRGLVSPAADWWALGTIVFELLTGHSLFVDDTGRREGNAGAVKRALDRGEYSFAEVTDPRWHLLLRGLLNRSYKDRWGHEQVREWLAGGSPEVVEVAEGSAAQAAPVPPLVLPWGTFQQPVEAVESLAAHWDDASGYLTGQGSTHLRLWLERSPVGDAASHLLKAVHDQDLSVDEALVMLQVVVAPDRPLQYRGRVVGGGTLSEVARLAAAGDTAAQEWIKSLRRRQVLGAVANHTQNGAQLAALDLALQQRWKRLDDLLRSAEKNPQLRALVPPLRGRLEGVVLASVLDQKRDAAHLAAAARAASALTAQDPAPLRGWGEEAERGSVPDAIALELFGPAAVTARHAREAAERKAAEEQERVNRDREIRERRVRSRQELRNRVRTAGRRAGVRLGLSAILVLILTLSVWQVFGASGWQQLALAYAAPLVLTIAVAFAVESIVPAAPPRAAFGFGAAALGWQAISTLPDLTSPVVAVTATDPGMWLVGLAPWFLGGYIVGYGLALVAGRLWGRRARDPHVLTVALPLGAIVVAGVGALVQHLGSAPIDLGPGLDVLPLVSAITLPIIHSLPAELMWLLTLVVAAASVAVLSLTPTLGGLPPGLVRWIRVVLTVLAVLVIIYHLPLALLVLWVTLGVSAAVAVGAFAVSMVSS